jgi:hypothetical protein
MKTVFNTIGATSALPDWRRLFTGVERFWASTADDKVNGSGDSSGRATDIKAPGGRDAAKSSADGG